MRPLIVFLLLASSAFGQIKLSQEISQTWVGFESPQVVNGVVIAGSNSKPTLANTTTTIRVETAVEYKFSQLKATRLPSLEKISLERIEDGWRFKPSAPAGMYAVEYLAFDPEKGIASEEITVELKPVSPEPITPAPVDPLAGLQGESRAVMAAFVAAMANDMDAVAVEVEQGRARTVAEVSAVNVQRDIVTRNRFKADMARMMEPRLGNAALPPTAKQTFNDIAAGFRSVR
jgi:hypothetical protein